jgi:AcrR family transcriptional regulator
METKASPKKRTAARATSATAAASTSGGRKTAPPQEASTPAPANSYHHGDLRNALIAAGRAALEELGARELSLRSVAKSVGVSEAAPSRHFDGKEGLLAAVAAQGFLELAEKRRTIAASDQGPEEKLRQMMIEYVRFAQLHKGLFNLMVGPRIIQRDAYPELKESSTASFNLFAETVCGCARAHGWPEDRLNLVVHSAWAVEHGLATLILGTRAPHPRWPVKLKDMIDFSISLFIGSITAGPGLAGPAH